MERVDIPVFNPTIGYKKPDSLMSDPENVRIYNALPVDAVETKLLRRFNAVLSDSALQEYSRQQRVPYIEWALRDLNHLQSVKDTLLNFNIHNVEPGKLPNLYARTTLLKSNELQNQERLLTLAMFFGVRGDKLKPIDGVDFRLKRLASGVMNDKRDFTTPNDAVKLANYIQVPRAAGERIADIGNDDFGRTKIWWDAAPEDHSMLHLRPAGEMPLSRVVREATDDDILWHENREREAAQEAEENARNAKQNERPYHGTTFEKLNKHQPAEPVHPQTYGQSQNSTFKVVRESEAGFADRQRLIQIKKQEEAYELHSAQTQLTELSKLTKSAHRTFEKLHAEAMRHMNQAEEAKKQIPDALVAEYVQAFEQFASAEKRKYAELQSAYSHAEQDRIKAQHEYSSPHGQRNEPLARTKFDVANERLRLSEINIKSAEAKIQIATSLAVVDFVRTRIGNGPGFMEKLSNFITGGQGNPDPREHAPVNLRPRSGSRNIYGLGHDNGISYNRNDFNSPQPMDIDSSSGVLFAGQGSMTTTRRTQQTKYWQNGRIIQTDTTVEERRRIHHHGLNN